MKAFLKNFISAFVPFVNKYQRRIEQVNYLKKQNRQLFALLMEMKLKHESPKVGSAEWLELTEYKYGGTITNVPRKKVSNKDKRTKNQLLSGGMTGGDRMSRIKNNYAPIYTKHMQPFLHKKDKVVLAEVGILKGTGLAIWSDLYKNGRIIGFDIDLSHVYENMKNLKQKGAFSNNTIELYDFDQYEDNRNLLQEILNGEKFDVIIDDGIHTDEPIINTINSFMPFLNTPFVYIIEDNSTVYYKIKDSFPDFSLYHYGCITVMTNKAK